MIIKRFQGKTEEEATAAALKALGSNAVIMNVRSGRPKGFFAIFKPPVVEVTAGVEEESDNPPVRRPAAPVSTPAPKAEAAPAKPRFPGVIPDDEDEKEKKSASKPDESSVGIEAKIESLHSLLEETLKKDEESGIETGTNKNGETLRALKLIYSTLIDNEVDERYANEIISEIESVNRDLSRDRGISLDSVLAGIYQKMILMFGEADIVSPANNGPKVVYFIGPTGVGKTTTIAKIASKLRVEDNKKVALVTTDTYRIAATDQLKTYAGIMNTPFRILYTQEEMQKAYDEFSDFDFIMVDTAGHSPRNDDLKEGTRQFLHALDEKAEKEVYLVLSATTKYKDLIAISDTYKELDDYKLIFTKLDETCELGNLWNIRRHTGARMSYVTMGQNVPGDIAAFNPQTTVKKLLGGE